MRGGGTTPFLGLFENLQFFEKMIKMVKTFVSVAHMMSKFDICQFLVFLTTLGLNFLLFWPFLAIFGHF